MDELTSIQRKDYTTPAMEVRALHGAKTKCLDSLDKS